MYKSCIKNTVRGLQKPAISGARHVKKPLLLHRNIVMFPDYGRGAGDEYIKITGIIEIVIFEHPDRLGYLGGLFVLMLNGQREEMKRLLCLFLSFFIFPAFAVTSQSYVDSAVAPLQDEIPAEDSNAVLTNTGTAGEIGTKQIYDANADYASQQNALVTAETFNAAVQNAIDNEYVCIEWAGDVHDNAHCLLYQIRPAYNKSKNLFDVSKVPTRVHSDTTIVKNGDGSITVTRALHNGGITSLKTLKQLAPDLVVGNTYTLNFDTTGTAYHIWLNQANQVWSRNTTLTIQQIHLDSILFFYSGKCTVDGQCPNATISNIQIEEGAVATPYVPYGNVYMPDGE